MIGPPPKTVTILNKEYFPAEPMKDHLRELRAELMRLTFDRDDLRRANERLRLQLLGPH